MSDDPWRAIFDAPLDAFDKRFEKQLRHLRREQVQTAEEQVQTAEELARLSAENESLRERLGRQELVLRALIDWHLDRRHFDLEGLGLLVARADLSDGIEDGVLSPERSRTAPTCPNCRRPVNPQRDRCIFCDETVPEENVFDPSESRTRRCASCDTLTHESLMYFGGRGLLCEHCFHTRGA